MWPELLFEEMLRLLDEQRYAQLWNGILPLVFPGDLGFSFQRCPKGSSPSYVIVKHDDQAVLVVAWQRPQKVYGQSPVKIEPPKAMPHKEHTVLQLQTAGHIASYYEIDTRTWDSKRAHPNNALYGLLEPGGAIVFRDCISEVFRAAGVLVCGHREFSPEAIDTATRYLQYRYDSVVEPPLVTDRDIRVMTVYEHLERMQMASRTIGFKQSFPTELVAMIVSLLDTESLCEFSCVNSYCNDLANRRLWSTFKLTAGAKSDDDVDEIKRRLYAMGRNPRRAQYIRTLVIGPCGWRWTTSLVDQLYKGIKCAGNISSLTLLNSSSPSPLGNEFLPVIRMLASIGPQLRLESFQFDGWLDATTPLIYFLSTQRQLKRLVGLDIQSGSSLNLPRGFLRSLHTLESTFLGLPDLLIPGRPIQNWIVGGSLTTDNISARLDLATSSSARMRSIKLDISTDTVRYSNSGVQNILHQVVTRLPYLKELDVHNLVITPTLLVALQSLGHLVRLRCTLSPDMNDPKTFATWLAKAPPRLNRVEYSSEDLGEVSWTGYRSRRRKALFWLRRSEKKRGRKRIIWVSDIPFETAASSKAE